jgi:hypothetical protein
MATGRVITRLVGTLVSVAPARRSGTGLVASLYLEADTPVVIRAGTTLVVPVEDALLDRRRSVLVLPTLPRGALMLASSSAQIQIS